MALVMPSEKGKAPIHVLDWGLCCWRRWRGQGQVPVKRLGTPKEITDAVVYFASDESAFTVKSELLIDGGMSEI
jgi:NAD(P)-dependent dehydrogenase (short-subunit alcohol dehydrogenase family)